jgi:hypothetical protein
MFEGTSEGKQNGMRGKTHVSLNITLFIYPFLMLAQKYAQWIYTIDRL